MTYTVSNQDGQAVAVESTKGLLSSFQATDAAAKINGYGYRSSYICVGYGTNMTVEVSADHITGDDIVTTCTLTYLQLYVTTADDYTINPDGSVTDTTED